jgi:hypothetical protein
MSQLLNLNEFAKKGVNSDILPWELPGDFVTDMENMRIVRNKISPFGGYSTWATLPVDFIPGYIMHIGSISGRFWLIAGRNSVQVFDSATFFDISSAGGYPSIPDENLWTGCMLSEIPIITVGSHYPEYWPEQSGVIQLEPLPWDATRTWADVNEQCNIIRSHKQYLFALGLTSNGVYLPNSVRWSSPADTGLVPETWDPLDTSNVAGITPLGGAGGTIIDGLTLRDAFVVYRESGITVFDYVGGQFVWQVRHLSTTSGLLSPECIVEVRGRHFFIGNGDILVNDGNSVQSLLHNRLRKRFSESYDGDNYLNAYAVKHNSASEVWFCVAEKGFTFPNIAYIYNWEDDTWSIRNIQESASANYGPLKDAATTWTTVKGTWGSASSSWTQSNASALQDSIISITKPVAMGTSGSMLSLDVDNTPSEVTYNSGIERLSFALDGLAQVTSIQRVYPHLNGPGTVYIQLGSQDYPGATVRWKPAVAVTASDVRKVDIRTTGELHCFRIFSENSSDYWEFSGMDIEYVKAGLR